MRSWLLKGKLKFHLRRWFPVINVGSVFERKRHCLGVIKKSNLLVVNSVAFMVWCMYEVKIEGKVSWQCGLAPAVNLLQSQMAGPWWLGCDGLALIVQGNPCLWVSEAVRLGRALAAPPLSAAAALAQESYIWAGGIITVHTAHCDCLSKLFLYSPGWGKSYVIG